MNGSRDIPRDASPSHETVLRDAHLRSEVEFCFTCLYIFPYSVLGFITSSESGPLRPSTQPPIASRRHRRLRTPVAYVGALQARLVSERSRKRCACGGVGTPRCTWRSPGAPGVVLFSKKRTCQVRLCISRCTWGSPGAPGDLQVHPRNWRCTCPVHKAHLG
jgi:hypothetical protein